MFNINGSLLICVHFTTESQAGPGIGWQLQFCLGLCEHARLCIGINWWTQLPQRSKACIAYCRSFGDSPELTVSHNHQIRILSKPSGNLSQ